MTLRELLRMIKEENKDADLEWLLDQPLRFDGVVASGHFSWQVRNIMVMSVYQNEDGTNVNLRIDQGA